MLKRTLITAGLAAALLASCGDSESPAPAEGSAAGEKDAGAKMTATQGAAKAPSSADAAKVADPSFGLDQLKAAAASFSVDDLKTAAGKLAESIMSQSGSAATLTEKLAKLSPTDISAMADLKKSVSTAESLVKDLRAKLEVVVGQLKAKGVDVAPYAGFLKSGG